MKPFTDDNSRVLPSCLSMTQIADSVPTVLELLWNPLQKYEGVTGVLLLVLAPCVTMRLQHYRSGSMLSATAVLLFSGKESVHGL